MNTLNNILLIGTSHKTLDHMPDMGKAMNQDTAKSQQTSLKHDHPDPLIRRMWQVIRIAVKALAVLMTLVIIWGTFDVIWMLYQRLSTPPYFLLNISDILATFGAFMAVLIAIEIFANIAVYLEAEIIHLRLVMSTALMAAARKVIVLDFSVHDFRHVIALSGIILALSVGYWIIGNTKFGQRPPTVSEPPGHDSGEAASE